MNTTKVILITLDEINCKALSCYGGPFATANIDRLATEGTLYTNAYTASPLCLPARCSIATGLAPHNTRSFCNNIGAPLDRDLPNIFTELKKAGYQTSKIGKCHFLPVTYKQNLPGMTQSYDHFKTYYESLGIDHLELQDDKQVSVWYYDDYAKELDEAGYLEAYRHATWNKDYRKVFPFPGPEEWHPDSWVGRKAVEFIENCQPKDKQFLWISFSGPHYPVDPPQKYLDKIDMNRDLPRKFKPDEFSSLDQIHHASYHGPGCIDGGGPAGGVCKNYDEDYWQNWRRNYYANVIQIDDYIGKIMTAATARWGENTLVILSADHGEMMGAHGLWGKRHCAYEEVWRIPMIVKYPSQQQNTIDSSKIMNTDIMPTIMNTLGLECPACDGIAMNTPDSSNSRKYVVTESDDFVAVTNGRFKYIRARHNNRDYVEVYDLKNDPEEFDNIAAEADNFPEVAEMLQYLDNKQKSEQLFDILFYDRQGTPPWFWNNKYKSA